MSWFKKKKLKTDPPAGSPPEIAPNPAQVGYINPHLVDYLERQLVRNRPVLDPAADNRCPRDDD
ncbi:MAG: hypothetical protein COV08_00525 [Candidatus Vogelbacteria bacterium CG10_big_fil_rev_8_21_14_0_10_49_38]|uniref:Uncharacterized protein n=1 Tax=Candidatus Vogelbacteria bacterium CG10_big_fil_rev_8_21_14_0_10_49_38 TaxID=1975043 RepID=A0A2H0RIT7_9BACT|nr:MAG: hypothetical protein BK006_00525 [bacterium CG10_49_38]PIR46403.1 MAG: hypothetical protein COV08_00525 [Candidatus Vogelbacteria bacterium CG10_big_fil_rev_8_21_14_0_10_49_38]